MRTSAGDLARDFALQRQNILKIALIAFRPQVLVAGRVNELGGDADPLTGAQNRAFNHSVDI